MKIPNPRALWRLEGTVDRSGYALGGVAGFALKYLIDWSVVTSVFGLPWSPFSYWRLVHMDQATPRITPEVFLVLFALSLPFLWFGMAMTLLRLRDAGQSAGWAALFFIPVANVALFIGLSLLPTRSAARRRDLSGALESAFFAIVLTVGIGTAAIAIATKAVATYGIGLFVAVPFCVGYLSAFLQVRRNPEGRNHPYLGTLLALALLGGLLLAIAWEGIVCLAMAAPLAIAVGLIGAFIGNRFGRRNAPPAAPAQAYMVAALLPLMIGGEAALHRTPPVYRVDTSIVVNAPPEAVWRNVVSFSDIPGAPEWYFRAGIAYPLRARIDGRGVGAVRHCEFTTGSFVEPITVWNEPSLLRFDVTANPSPMSELSPYGPVDARHLHGFLMSKAGQFELRPLAGGRTLLTGSTWYQHGLWPAEYWRLWSDGIIHRIHLRVLRHVKALSERS